MKSFLTSILCGSFFITAGEIQVTNTISYIVAAVCAFIGFVLMDYYVVVKNEENNNSNNLAI